VFEGFFCASLQIETNGIQEDSNILSLQANGIAITQMIIIIIYNEIKSVFAPLNK